MVGMDADKDVIVQPGAIRWDGQRWQRMPGDFYVRDVAVLAPDDVWALGATSVDTGVVHHWDGTGWTGTRLPMDYPDRPRRPDTAAGLALGPKLLLFP